MSLFPSRACALVLLSACTANGPSDDVLIDDSGTARADDSAPGESGVPPDDSGDPIAPLPRDTYNGTVYSGLDVAWFQWILGEPRVGNPGFDPTGDACAFGQSGDVWFLAASFSETVVERTCTIPSGTKIFFPILNEYDGCLFYDPCTDAGLVSKIEDKLDRVTGMYATIDGYDMGNPADYRVSATEFSVTLPRGNLFQALGVPVSGLVEDLYGGGYWMLFDPLPPGEHTVTFGGVSSDGRAHDTTYTLTVK